MKFNISVHVTDISIQLRFKSIKNTFTQFFLKNYFRNIYSVFLSILAFFFLALEMPVMN